MDKSCSENWRDNRVVCLAVTGVTFILLVIAVAAIVPIVLLDNNDKNGSSTSISSSSSISQNSSWNASSTSTEFQTSTKKLLSLTNNISTAATKPLFNLQMKNATSFSNSEHQIKPTNVNVDAVGISTVHVLSASSFERSLVLMSSSSNGWNSNDSNIPSRTSSKGVEKVVHEITTPTTSVQIQSELQTAAEEFEGSTSGEESEASYSLREISLSAAATSTEHNKPTDQTTMSEDEHYEGKDASQETNFTAHSHNLLSTPDGMTLPAAPVSALTTEPVEGKISPNTIGLDKTTTPPPTDAATSTKQITTSVSKSVVENVSTKSTLNEASVTISSTTTTTPSKNCEVFYNHTCFWLIRKTMDYVTGRNFCRSEGGDAANIYKKKHYKLVLNYIRSSIPSSRKHDDIWLGMWIEPKTRSVAFNGGGKASYIEWMPEQPSAVYHRRKIYIHVIKSKYSKAQGMVNHVPQFTSTGILCEEFRKTTSTSET